MKQKRSAERRIFFELIFILFNEEEFYVIARVLHPKQSQIEKSKNNLCVRPELSGASWLTHSVACEDEF
jgi:hypothetical protein